jgi:hypothetical protein
MPSVLVVKPGMRVYAQYLKRRALPALIVKARRAIVSQVYSLSFLYYDDAPPLIHICRRSG